MIFTLALTLLFAVATTTTAEPTCEESISVGVNASSWTVGVDESLSGIGEDRLPNGQFTLLKYKGVEVGIRASEQSQGPIPATDTNDDSIGEYAVETGSSPSQTSFSWWNFDWYVDVSGANNNTKRTIDKYDGSFTVECVDEWVQINGKQQNLCGRFGESYELINEGVYEILLGKFGFNEGPTNEGPTNEGSTVAFLEPINGGGVAVPVPVSSYSTSANNVRRVLSSNSVLQNSWNMGDAGWPWGIGFWNDESYDQDVEVTYKMCLILGTDEDGFCPVCMLVKAALASSAPSGVPSLSEVPSQAPSGVPSQAPSGVPSQAPSGVPSLSGKPSLAIDPFDKSDGGVPNKAEVKVDFEATSTSGTCPPTSQGIDAIQSKGETLCTNVTEAVGNTNPETDFCVSKVTEYECTETPTANRKLSGRRLEGFTETAVLELVITTYCSSTGGDTYSGCDPDDIEDINNQVEDAITDLIDNDPDLTFDEIVADLVDDLRSWYPRWGSSESECKNDGKYPSYMKRSGVITSSLESCCSYYYGWEEDTCIANSGGSTAEYETGDFYIDWSKVKGNGEGYCVRACLEEDSALDPPLVNCGGINEGWERAYSSAEKCCEQMQTYVNKEYCIAKSEGGPDAPFNPAGSGEWYVQGDDCKRDCTTSDSECDALDLSDTWTVKYDDKDDCCKLLTWLTDDDGNCPAQADYGDDAYDE